MNEPLSASHDDVRRHEPTLIRYAVLAWLCLAATIAYICRNSIGVAESTIRAELELTEKQMGLVIAAFFLPYALAQIPAGWLGNSWGSRRAIPFFSVCWSLFTGLMALVSTAPLLILTRLGNGLFQAGLFPCCTNTIGKWFPGHRRAVAAGSLASFMSLGGAAGAALTGVLIVEIGWRWTFGLYSLLGVAWSAGFYAWFRDLPEQHPRVNEAELEAIRVQVGQQEASPTEEETGQTKEAIPWRGLLSSPATWWICGQQFCRAAGQIFFASWFATYLQETRGVSIEESGLLNSLPLLSVVVGSLTGGAASDWVLSRTGSRRLARQGVAGVSMWACAAFVFAAYFIQQPLLAVVTISAGTFCAAVGGPCAYSITIDMGGRHVPALFGSMNMVGNLGALTFIYAVPWFLELYENWDSVLLLFGVLYVGAAVCWMLLNPNGTIFEQSLLEPETK